MRQELTNQIQRNFRWMPELVSLLRKYEKKQHKFGNFENLYPHIITFFADVAKKENEQFKVLK